MASFEDILRDDSLPTHVLNKVMVTHIDSQELFDQFFAYAYDSDKHIVMRVFSVVEKITLQNADFIQPHKEALLRFCDTVKETLIKYHLPLVVSKLVLTEEELGKVWDLLTTWLLDTNESRSVRSNSLSGLFNLLSQCKELEQDYLHTVSLIRDEDIPAIQARLRRLKL